MGDIPLRFLCRIISASLSSAQYVLPEESGFSDDYVLTAWHVIPGHEKIPVKVHISGQLADTFRNVQWHPAQQVEECGEGGIILRAEVPGLYEVARWVLSGAPHIKVIAPEELREIVREFAQEIMKQFKEG